MRNMVLIQPIQFMLEFILNECIFNEPQSEECLRISVDCYNNFSNEFWHIQVIKRLVWCVLCANGINKIVAWNSSMDNIRCDSVCLCLVVFVFFSYLIDVFVMFFFVFSNCMRTMHTSAKSRRRRRKTKMCAKHWIQVDIQIALCVSPKCITCMWCLYRLLYIYFHFELFDLLLFAWFCRLLLSYCPFSIYCSDALLDMLFYF